MGQGVSRDDGKGDASDSREAPRKLPEVLEYEVTDGLQASRREL